MAKWRVCGRSAREIVCVLMLAGEGAFRYLRRGSASVGVCEGGDERS